MGLRLYRVSVKSPDPCTDIQDMQSAAMISNGPAAPYFEERPLPPLFDLLVDRTSELGQSLAARWRAEEEECAHILPQALAAGYTPQELYDTVIERLGPEATPLAIKARRRLWEAQTSVTESAS